MTDTAPRIRLPRPGPRSDSSREGALVQQLRERGVYVAIGILLVYNLIFTPNFATVDNLRLQLVQVVPIAIVALGMALVIATEGIDLSVGSVMAITAAVIPLYLGYGPWIAVAIGIAAGAAVGALNGALVAWCGIQPIIATLGVLVAGRAVALVLADGRLVEIFDPTILSLGNGTVQGIPVPLVLVAALTVLLIVVVRWSTFGRRLVAIGGNRRAARLAGLPVGRTLFTVYVASGVLAAVAAVIYTARLGASDPSFVGYLIELSAITAVVVGGTPLSGGRIKIVGTLMGALLMQLIAATVIQHDLPDSVARMTQAAIIVVAVYLQRDRAGA